MNALAAAGGLATAQEIAKATAITHGLVRTVLIKLAKAGVVTTDEPARNRGEQFYRVSQASPWTELAALSRAIVSLDVVHPAVEVTYDAGLHSSSQRDPQTKSEPAP